MSTKSLHRKQNWGYYIDEIIIKLFQRISEIIFVYCMHGFSKKGLDIVFENWK